MSAAAPPHLVPASPIELAFKFPSYRMPPLHRFTTLLAFAAFLALCGACNRQSGPRRYSVSGAVTMPDGAPVPAGEISFEPSLDGGNSGPGSTTQIKDGKYTIAKEQGIVGGEYVVSITPFDGIAVPESPQGQPLRRMPYSEKVQLPAEDSTRDFKIK
jgi:hypothetical protein